MTLVCRRFLIVNYSMFPTGEEVEIKIIELCQGEDTLESEPFQ